MMKKKKSPREILANIRRNVIEKKEKAQKFLINKLEENLVEKIRMVAVNRKAAEEAGRLKMSFWREINKRGGTNVKLVMKKVITASDVNNKQERLLLPFGKLQIESRDFLRADEEKMLEEKGGSIKVMLIQPKFVEEIGHVVNDIDLRKWKGGYVLTTKQWNLVVERNEIKEHQVFHVWSFRVGEGQTKLGFALVRI